MMVEPLESRRLLSTSIAQKILFIRGGSGTGGFLEGGSDEQLGDITNFSTANFNHGWGQFSTALQAVGFTPEQLIEGPAANNTPVNLAGMDLSQYRAIVFGSNNAAYSAAHVDALEDFVRQTGGGALFISDANFGRDWRDAADSDQAFLTRFGLVMNQDNGVYAIDRSAGDFVQPNHPIFEGVNSFDGEGVSPIVISGAAPPGVTRTRLAVAKAITRNNDGTNPANLFQGTLRAVDGGDGSLVIATAGGGRVAGHFDRNTFFNTNGAGTSIVRLDNRVYAQNLLRWLAYGDPEANPPTLEAGRYAYEQPRPAVTLRFSEDVSPSLQTGDFQITNLATGQAVPTGNLSLAWDRATRTASLSFVNAGGAGGALPDGNYRVFASRNGIADPFGNALAADINFTFFVLAGDANRDRRVDNSDFAILAGRFNQPGTFADGDFDYSGTVGLADFSILASKFNATLPSSRPAPAAALGLAKASPPAGFAERSMWEMLEEPPS